MAKKEKNTSVGKLILKLFSQTEIIAEQLLHLDKKLLANLLADRLTGRNIMWACSDYKDLGEGFAEWSEMTVASITGKNEGLVKPAVVKAGDSFRQSRQKTDVFTPTWVCNLQNNLLDESFFGRSNAFNSPCGQKGWRTRSKDTDRRGRVIFSEGKTWKEYVQLNRMEITCGEAPYLVSRYNTEDGKIWPINRRIGLLDRKLRLVSENTTNERQWLKWAYEAYRHTYGFEWRGDYLFLARLNLLATFVDYYKDKFRKAPSLVSLLKIAQILSWNLWQMDGLTGQKPGTIPQPFMENSLFPEANADFCSIRDWDHDKSFYFITLRSRWCRPTLHFDAIVGNPPFQKISATEVSGAPVYHLFIDLAAELGERSVVIHPARFLYDAGKTPRSWNNKIRTNPHFRLTHYFASSKAVFTGVDIKGGVAVTLHDTAQRFPAISTYFSNTELSAIVSRVTETPGFVPFSEWIYPRDLYRLTEQVYVEHPELEGRQSKGHRFDVGSGVFCLFPELLSEERPENYEDYIGLLGRQGVCRVMKWIKRRYLKLPDNVDCYKVLVAKSNGNGTLGEALSSPLVAAPGEGHTTTFLSIGQFQTETEAQACLLYIKTRFARTLLSSLKVTQDNPREVWQNVPLQDFTAESDIRWDASLEEIDLQLFAKYGLSEEERSFVQTNIKPME